MLIQLQISKHISILYLTPNSSNTTHILAATFGLSEHPLFWGIEQVPWVHSLPVRDVGAPALCVPLLLPITFSPAREHSTISYTHPEMLDPCLMCPALAALVQGDCTISCGQWWQRLQGDCQQCQTMGWLLLFSLWVLTVCNFFDSFMLLFQADSFVSNAPLQLTGYCSN